MDKDVPGPVRAMRENVGVLASFEFYIELIFEGVSPSGKRCGLFNAVKCIRITVLRD